jgi:hypothetical protein
VVFWFDCGATLLPHDIYREEKFTMPTFFLILTAYCTILPSCLDIFLILDTSSVAKQTSLSHVSLFSFASISLIHGMFDPDPIVFFFRNIFALTVSLINCFVRIYYSNRHELKREIFLDAFTFWVIGGVVLYGLSDVNTEEDTILKLAILVGASNNFNVYSSIFPLVFYRAATSKSQRFSCMEIFPLVTHEKLLLGVMYM